MARVKRAVHSKKHRRVVLERAKGYYGNKSRSLPLRQRAGHALPAVRLPRPPGPEGRLPEALDPADQRGVPLRTAPPTAGSSPACGVAEIEVDRKVLADLAVHEPEAFAALVAQATAASAKENA